MPILVVFQKLAQLLEVLTLGVKVLAIGFIPVVCRLVHGPMKAATYFIGPYQSIQFNQAIPP